MSEKRALITGVTGQDGAYLAELLTRKGYRVYGTFRRTSSPNFWRLQHLGVTDKVTLIPVDLGDTSSLIEAIKIAQPTEVYNLAAQSFVGASYETPISTAEATGLAVCRLLEVIRHVSPHSRFYQASTSELYGSNGAIPQDEQTTFRPISPYAAAKLYGHVITTMYRDAYGLFAATGILFNHESPLRGLEFVTRKITNAAAKIKLGLETTLPLGNLEARRDWGFAPEYVEAMWAILQQPKAADYVIATGESFSVQDFCEFAFEHIGLDWREHVRTEPRLLRPLDVNYLQGDATFARKTLGWQHRTNGKRLAELMVEEDLARWERWQRGEKFPWDAPFHNEEMRVMTRSLRV